MFGELTENFTRRRNDQLQESAITCHGHLCLPWSWTTGGSIVRLLEDFYFYYILPRRSQGHNLFCTSEMLTLCQLAYASVVGLLTLLLNLPGQTITIWCDNIVISYRYIHITNVQQKPTRARTFPLARYMIQSNLPSHFFPCISVMMVTCYNVSFRQQDATPHVVIRWDFTSQTSLL